MSDTIKLLNSIFASDLELKNIKHFLTMYIILEAVDTADWFEQVSSAFI